MDIINSIGYVAAFLTTVAFVPQVFKTWKSKHTKDISLLMYTAFCVVIFLWLAYGFLIASKPIIYANVFTLILAFVILALKLRYK